MIRGTTILTIFLCISAASLGQTANFSAATTSGCSPLVVNFQNLSTGNPTSYYWDFGNGATSTLVNPSTTYFTPGTYTVKLTATIGQSSNTLTRTQYITVYGKPALNFTVNDSTACFPHPAQFTDLSVASTGTTNSTWLWDFGDGTQASTQNPLHTYTASGSYTITMKITNDKGCYAVITKPAYIIIAGGVTADFTSNQPTVCRPPFNISFTNSSSGPGSVNWYWNFGDGNTSSQQNPSHAYTTPGNYTVSLAITSSDGCSDTIKKTNHLVIQNINTTFTAPDSICIKSPVNFVNSSTPPPVSSSWTFGDNSSSFLTSPQKTYTTVGTYTVKLINTYSYCTDSFSKTIKILPRPVAAFTAPITTRCQPNLTVNFQNSSSNGVAFAWDFGDGNSSNQQNPAHTYTAYGSFDVRLIVTNASGCTDTLTRPAYVRIQKPVITVPSLPQRGCIPYTISPVANINTLDAVTSYSWDFGDGSGTFTAANPVHTYTVQGTYTVTLTITTSTGCTETYTIVNAVQVGRHPVVNFSAVPTIACAFQEVQFTDLTNEADEWLWFFGDGTSATVKNPIHQYSDTGLMDVRLYAINNGCLDSFNIDDYIRIKPPIAKFEYTTTCLNRLQFSFLDSSIGATSWVWDFGDGITSTAQNPVHIYSAYNTYNVTLTVSNDTCTHSLTKVIRVINESPDFVGGDTICRNTTVLFQATNIANPQNITNYAWDFGNGQTSPTNTGVFASQYYVNSGSYNVMMVTTDIYGCKDTVSKNNYVTVNGPVGNFSALNPTGCKGLTVDFTDGSVGDGTHNLVSWVWNYGDGTIQSYNAPPFQHTYPNTGTYTVTMKVTDASGCSDSIVKHNYVVTSEITADFHALDTFFCPGSYIRFVNTSTGTNFTNYWDFGFGITDTQVEPYLYFMDTGWRTIKLVVTDQYGCRDSMIRPNYIYLGLPSASFTVNDSISACTPFEVQFNNTSTYTASSYWDLGGGTSYMTNPIQFYNTPGVYQVQLFATAPGGCKDTAYGSITVVDTAGSKITYLPLNGCKPLGVDLTAFSPGPTIMYTWDFGDGTLFQNDTSISSHIYYSFGNFVPKVILGDVAGCLIPVTGLDTIRIKGATVKFGIDKSLLCDSGLVYFSDSTLYNDSVSVYNWDFGDGQGSNLQHPLHYYSAPGNYSVSLNVQTLSACVDTFRLSVPIKVVESPLVSIGGDSVICVNEFMTHLGLFNRPDTSLVKWSWKFPNGNNSFIQNPGLQQYTVAGNFTVSTIATNSSGCKDTATKNILINPLPVVSMPSTLTMQAGFPVTIPATYSSNVVSYNWTPATTLSCPDCPQPAASPKFNTKYKVNFVDSNGCRNEGEIQIIVICGNANVFVPNTFSPNGDGANDVFYVRGKGLDRVKSLRIFNRWGEVVFEQSNFPINNPAFGWDGKFKGNKPVSDVYVYQVEVFCDNSQVIRFEGNVALIQ